MNNINFKLAQLIFGILIILYIPCIILIATIEEGNSITGNWIYLYYLVNILCFPFIYLFELFFHRSFLLFYLGLFLNFTLYSLIIERLVFYLKCDKFI